MKRLTSVDEQNIVGMCGKSDAMHGKQRDHEVNLRRLRHVMRSRCVEVEHCGFILKCTSHLTFAPGSSSIRSFLERRTALCRKHLLWMALTHMNSNCVHQSISQMTCQIELEGHILSWYSFTRRAKSHPAVRSIIYQFSSVTRWHNY